MKQADHEKAEARTWQVSVRIPPDLRAKVDAAAARSGRSISSEMQVRLERSLADDERDPLGRDPLLKMIAATIEMIQGRTGRSYWDDARTADACRDAVSKLMLILPSRDGEQGLGRAYIPLDVNALVRAAIEHEAGQVESKAELRRQLKADGVPSLKRTRRAKTDKAGDPLQELEAVMDGAEKAEVV